MRSNIWLMGFLLKKKWIWVLGTFCVIYIGVVPFQSNLLISFDDIEVAKKMFWDTAYLYHTILMTAFIFQSAIQLVNSETKEITGNKNKKIAIAFVGVFTVYQMLAIPAYIWYLIQYPLEGSLLCGLVFSELLCCFMFYVVCRITKQPLIGFLVIFLLLLLLL